MYAVIKTGGKQYRVAQGDVLRIEKLPAEVGNTIDFEHVLMLVDAGKVKIGSPVVAGCTVKAEVVRHGRGKKITVIKFKRRKGYRRKMGHPPIPLLRDFQHLYAL